MASKKSDQGSSSASLPALRIGSRVRCTDDGVEGRITWANGVSVKVQWDDGEQVTWRRDSLADRPIEILDPASEAEQSDGERTVPTESPRAEPETASPPPEGASTEPTPSTTEPATAECVPPVPKPAEGQTTPAIPDSPVAMPVKPKRQRKAPAAPKEKKLSALDSAAKVLVEAGQALNCQEMIAAMAAKGYWTSPGGKTPAATLYSAIAREITTKGTISRFQKSDRGKFAHTGVA
jgi:hypothetical protein